MICTNNYLLSSLYFIEYLTLLVHPSSSHILHPLWYILTCTSQSSTTNLLLLAQIRPGEL